MKPFFGFCVEIWRPLFNIQFPTWRQKKSVVRFKNISLEMSITAFFNFDLDFWKWTKMGFLKIMFGNLLPPFLTCLVLSDPLKLFKKSWELAWTWAHIWPMFCIYRFFRLYTTKPGLGVHNFVIMGLWEFLAIFLDNFLKLEAMTDLHILSDPDTYFWKWPKKGFSKNWHFNQITKTQFKNLKFGMVVNWHK